MAECRWDTHPPGIPKEDPISGKGDHLHPSFLFRDVPSSSSCPASLQKRLQFLRLMLGDGHLHRTWGDPFRLVIAQGNFNAEEVFADVENLLELPEGIVGRMARFLFDLLKRRSDWTAIVQAFYTFAIPRIKTLRSNIVPKSFLIALVDGLPPMASARVLDLTSMLWAPVPLSYPSLFAYPTRYRVPLLYFNNFFVHRIPIVLSVGTRAVMGKSTLLNKLFSTRFDENGRGFFHTGSVDISLDRASVLGFHLVDVQGEGMGHDLLSFLTRISRVILLHLSPKDFTEEGKLIDSGSLRRGLTQLKAALRHNVLLFVFYRDYDDEDEEELAELAEENLIKFFDDGSSAANIFFYRVQKLSTGGGMDNEFLMFQNLFFKHFSGHFLKKKGKGGLTYTQLEEHLIEASAQSPTIEVDVLPKEVRDTSERVASLLSEILASSLKRQDDDVSHAIFRFTHRYEALEEVTNNLRAMEESGVEDPEAYNCLLGERETILSALQSLTPSPVVIEFCKLVQLRDLLGLQEFERQLADWKAPLVNEAISSRALAVEQIREWRHGSISQTTEEARITADIIRYSQVIDQFNIRPEHFWREIINIDRLRREIHDHSLLPLTSTELEDSYLFLLNAGIPVEILNGDQLNMPRDFLSRVFAKCDGSRPLFVVSVLGPQSSAKSTLMNVLFGCRFPVSAGRCTKGVNATLLRSEAKNADDLLILDAEGLLSVEKADRSFDRQLTLFVTSLSNVVIVNVKGEIGDEMREIIEIAVYALEKLTLLKVRPRVLFVLRDMISADKEKQFNTRRLIEESLRSAVAEVGGTYTLEDLLDFDVVDSFDLMCQGFNQVRTNISGDTVLVPVPNPQFGEQCYTVRRKIFDYAVKTKKHGAFADLHQWMIHAETVWTTLTQFHSLIQYNNLLELKQKRYLAKVFYSLVDKHIHEGFTQKFASLRRRYRKKIMKIRNELQLNTILESETGLSITKARDREAAIRSQFVDKKDELFKELEAMTRDFEAQTKDMPRLLVESFRATLNQQMYKARDVAERTAMLDDIDFKLEALIMRMLEDLLKWVDESFLINLKKEGGRITDRVLAEFNSIWDTDERELCDVIREFLKPETLDLDQVVTSLFELYMMTVPDAPTVANRIVERSNTFQTISYGAVRKYLQEKRSSNTTTRAETPSEERFQALLDDIAEFVNGMVRENRLSDFSFVTVADAIHSLQDFMNVKEIEFIHDFRLGFSLEFTARCMVLLRFEVIGQFITFFERRLTKHLQAFRESKEKQLKLLMFLSEEVLGDFETAEFLVPVMRRNIMDEAQRRWNEIYMHELRKSTELKPADLLEVCASTDRSFLGGERASRRSTTEAEIKRQSGWMLRFRELVSDPLPIMRRTFAELFETQRQNVLTSVNQRFQRELQSLMERVTILVNKWLSSFSKFNEIRLKVESQEKRPKEVDTMLAITYEMLYQSLRAYLTQYSQCEVIKSKLMTMWGNHIFPSPDDLSDPGDAIPFLMIGSPKGGMFVVNPRDFGDRLLGLLTGLGETAQVIPDSAAVQSLYSSLLDYALAGHQDLIHRLMAWIPTAERELLIEDGSILEEESSNAETLAFHPIHEGEDLVEHYVPLIVRRTVEFINTKGLNVEGLFRVPPSKSLVRKYEQLFAQGKDPDLMEINKDVSLCVHVAGGMLKSYFRNLPAPIIPYELQGNFISAVKLSGVTRVNSLSQLVSSLADKDQHTLKYLCNFLAVVASHAKWNKMPVDALATVFAVTLFRATSMVLANEQRVLKHLINDRVEVFAM